MIVILTACIFVISRGAMSTYERFGEGMSIMIGAWLNMSIAFQMYILFRGNLFQKVLSVFLIIIAITVLPFTGSRGALVSMILGGGITFLSKRAFFRSMAALLFIGIILLAVLIFAAPESMKERLVSLSYSESGRSEIFPLAAITFLKYPVRGIGAGGFAYVDPSRITGSLDYRRYPHNLWLETASEQGLMGLIPLGILTFLGFKRIYWIRKYFDIGFSRPCQLLFWMVTLQVAFTGDLPMSRGFFAVYGFLAGLSQCYKKEEQEYVSSYSIDYENVDLISQAD
jgi:O-antigen ligase